jgi:hypothetical protein
MFILPNHAVMPAEIKTVGASGQISLGKRSAGRTVTVDRVAEGVWTIKTAQVIPDDELWVHSPDARSSLDRALDWSASHPRSATNLKAVARRARRKRQPPVPVRLDLNNPVFQEQWFSLEKEQRIAVLSCCRKLAAMEWNAIYVDKGLWWELIQSRTGAAKERLYSTRITQKMHAVVKRSGDFLEFLTLHADHDSTDREPVGQAVEFSSRVSGIWDTL